MISDLLTLVGQIRELYTLHYLMKSVKLENFPQRMD